MADQYIEEAGWPQVHGETSSAKAGCCPVDESKVVCGHGNVGYLEMKPETQETTMPKTISLPICNREVGKFLCMGKITDGICEKCGTNFTSDGVSAWLRNKLTAAKGPVILSWQETEEILGALKAVSPSLESRHDEQSYGEKRVGFTRLKAAGNLKAAPPATETQQPNFATEDWCYEHAHSLPCRICASIPTREEATETAPQSQREMMMAPLPKGVEDTPEIRQRLQDWVDGTSELRAALREKEAELASVAQELEQLSTITAGTCGACGCNLNVYAAQSRELESVKAELATAKQEREDIRLELLQIGCDQHISKSHPDGTVE